MILYNFSQSAVWNFLRIQIYDLQGTFTEIMLISSIPSLFGFLFSKFWGDLSDIIGSRKLFIAVGIFLSTVFIPLFTYTKSTLILLIIYFAISFAGTMVSPAVNAAISETASFEQRGRQIGIYTSLFSIGWTGGTMLGGYFVDLYGFNAMYMISFITGLLSLTPLITYKEAYLVKKTVKNVREVLKETLNFEVGNDKVKYLSAAMFIHVAASSLFYNLFTLLFYEIVNRSATIYGIINGAAGIGSIIVPKMYGDVIDKIGRKKMYVATSLVYVPYFLTLTYVRNVILLTVLWFIPIWPGIQISITALATDVAEKDKVGKAQGLIQAVASLARIIGPLAGGFLADVFNATVNINNITPILTMASILPLFSALIALKL